MRRETENTNHLMDSTTPNETDEEYRLHPARWLVLASFSLLSLTNSWMWITWSPIAASVATLWDVSESQVDALSGVYMYIYVPGSFVSLWLVVNRLHLYRGLLVGGTLNALGALVRYTGRYNYTITYIGTLSCAMAQTFILSAPPYISGSWFGAHERATATALGVLANQLGTAVGLGATTFINFYNQDLELNVKTLQIYLGVQLTVAFMALLFVRIGVSDRPPTPPSAAAAAMIRPVSTKQVDEESMVPTEKTRLDCSTVEDCDHKLSPGYLESVRMVFTDSMPFLVAFGLSVGCYYTVPTFLSQLVPTWSSRKSGWLGIIYQLSGLVGSFLSGRALDQCPHQEHFICLGLLFGALISILVFMWNEQARWSSTAGMGLSLAALNTFGLEVGTAMTYPASEAVGAGVLECAAELGGFLLVTIGGSLPAVNDSLLMILFGAVSYATILVSCTRVKSKRPR